MLTIRRSYLIMIPIFHEEKEEGTQWGKPGPGGPYWRQSALTGQNFFDKMVRRRALFHGIGGKGSRAQGQEVPIGDRVPSLARTSLTRW
jgi:hypothetical protein